MCKLSMRGGDLVGAYLITLANPDSPVHIKTPQGYTTPFGTRFQAIGNLYGFLPARNSTNVYVNVDTKTHRGT